MSPGVAPAGRPDADEVLTALFRAHYTGLVALAVCLTGDKPAAEDLVQDAFAKMYRHWHRLREPDRALAYLRACVANGHKSRLRRLQVARRHATTLLPDAASAEEQAMLAGEHADLVGALRRLPTRQRQVLALRYFAELTDPEIASCLSLAASSVRVHAHRGLAALTRHVEAQA